MLLPESKNKINKIVIDILWSHWIKLGAHVAGEKCKAACDPEALLVLTVLMSQEDQRLSEIMGQWLYHYESIINIERLKNALKLVPVSSEVQFFYDTFSQILEICLPPSSFAKKRWEKLISYLSTKSVKPKNEMVKTDYTERKKIQEHEKIIKENFLMVFRYAFGVGAKADLINFFAINYQGFDQNKSQHLNAAQLAKLLHYNPATIHRALEDLLLSGMIIGDESFGHKSFALNTEGLLHFKKSKKDDYYFDWFLFIPLILDVVKMPNDLMERHESIILYRLNQRLVLLDNLIKKLPLVKKEILSQKSLAEIHPDELWQRYVQGFNIIYKSLCG